MQQVPRPSIIPLSSQKVVLTPIAMRRINAPLLNNFYMDTNVVVSVTERKERDLTKLFDDTSVDWAIIKGNSLLGANCIEQVRDSD